MNYLAMTLKAVSDDGTGEFEAILSTSTEDRDREVVAAKAFEPLPPSVPIYYQHDWQQKALPIGRGEPFYDGDGSLRIKGYYGSDDRSQAVRKAVGEGLVDSMSAGYLPLEKQRVKGVQTVVKADLFEGSMTAIPVNKTALVTASKALDAPIRPAAKAIIGSVEALQDRVRDALNDSLPRFCCLRGVVPSADGGTVYFDAWPGDPYDGDLQSFSQTYTDDGRVVTLTGEPTAVDILETVQADPDTKSTDETTTEATGEPAAEVAVKSADEVAASLALSETALRLAFSG